MRVSTEIQAQEGVSLDAQQARIRAYCKANGIKLVHMATDDVSGKSLERPGLQHALGLLDAGKANTLIVVKLDRLTRSVLDLGTLLEGYFLKQNLFLLSVTESLDTRNAMGRFVLYILALIAQWEREAISERTREALRHLKEQGAPLGCAPYGYRYAATRDEQGRRVVEEVPAEQEAIQRIVELFEHGMVRESICAALEAEGKAPPRAQKWKKKALYYILKRAGKLPERVREYKPRPKVPIVRDKAIVAARARELRAEGLSLRDIGERLQSEKLYPARGGRWHAATVAELLKVRDSVGAAQRALELRAQGDSLREIGRKLLYEGFFPAGGGQWHPMAVSGLLNA